MSKEFDDDLVRRLAGLLDETGLGEIEYAHKDFRIRVARPVASASYAVAAPAPAAAPAPSSASTPDAAPAAVETGETVPSPIVGTAYIAPSPDAAPYAAVGSTVQKGQTVMLIEAMKVMNPITAPRAGVVKQVMVENGQPVEYGQPLLILE